MRRVAPLQRFMRGGRVGCQRASELSITTVCSMRHACPMSTPAPTPVSVDSQMQHPTCPVAGSIPVIRCPMEEAQNAKALAIWSQLGKSRLSAFVTATATAGYFLCGGTSLLAATGVTVGTMLQSCSANNANQCIEVENDRMMKRTCRRPLVIGQITLRNAILLSASQLGLGTLVLYSLNPEMAALGAFNWFLYVYTYTPLKRVSTTNTWWGAIVGAIPPLMGGVCATGSLLGAPMHPAYLLGLVMFFWQIPHFMSLAFHCRRDYEAAGFKMLPFSHPTRASFYSIALSVLMGVSTVAGPAWIGMPVEGWFYPVSVAANGTMIYKSWKFHVDPVRNCRGCFVFSYMYLAVILAALMLNHVQPVTRAVQCVDYFFTPAAAPTAEAAVDIEME